MTSLNKHTLQIFSNNHRPLVIMDGCNKCCGINTESLKYGWLQVLPWNNDTITEKKDDRNLCRQMADFSLNMYMPKTKEVSQLVTIISPCYNSCSTKTH